MAKDEAKRVRVQTAQEPIAWLATETIRWLREYDGPACAMRTAVHNRPITSDGGVPVYLKPAAQDGAEVERLTAERDAARDEARRMDLARNQFLGERNMLAEALRDIQRGDMTNMMELTEAEAARARATWALRKIGEPVGDFRAERDALRAENEQLIRLIRLAHPVMRECGWQLAPACAAEGSDGILEAACAEIEEEFGDMLRTDGGEAGQ